MARFIKLTTDVKTERGHVISWLNLDSVKGFRLWKDENHHNRVDVYFVDGDFYLGSKEDTDPFRYLAEEQHP